MKLPSDEVSAAASAHQYGSGSSSSSSSSSPLPPPLVTFRARKIGPKCPFGNDVVEFSLRPGGCVCLSGKSGLGKTTLASLLTGLSSALSPAALRRKLHIDVEVCHWDPSIPLRERCGILFQQTTLLDELTVAGNLQVALQQYYQQQHQQIGQSRNRQDIQDTTNNKNNISSSGSRSSRDGLYYFEIKQLLDLVGLDFDRDAHKRPTELSGGMGRRASLALQLAAHKRVIVLDEPFTGLDYEAAMSVAKELVHLRTMNQNRRHPQDQKQHQPTALVLISHEPHLTQVVMNPQHTTDNTTITLLDPHPIDDDPTLTGKKKRNPSLFGTSFRDRFLERLADYTLFSLPLIVLAFVACGLAIAMVSADLLRRLDINDQVLQLVDEHVRPLIKLLTGQDATAFQMMGVRFKMQSLLNQTVPPAKSNIFAVGMTKLFVLEIGPLLTALLLCGRIGGSYAGKVGTLHATAQTKLLQTLGISPLHWTLWPSAMAALIAAPVLTVVGTTVALVLAGYVGPTYYGIGTTSQFRTDLIESLFPVLRVKGLETLWGSSKDDDHHQHPPGLTEFLSTVWNAIGNAPTDWTVTYRPRYRPSFPIVELVLECVTYPPIYHVVKSVTFIAIILGVAEIVAQWWKSHLTPRNVPSVITLSVVGSGLLVILADWGFSQLWLLRF